MQKKQNRRSRTRFPGLVRELNVRSKWDYLDQDYVRKLSDDEKQYLSDFNEEFYGGTFTHKRKLHRTKKERRECYGRNNSRNRDLFATSKACNALESFHPILQYLDEHNPERKSQDYCAHNHEDVILELLDLYVIAVAAL